MCPFSTNGLPTNPVFSEFPEDPAFLIIGESPGYTDVRLKRPFMGPSGAEVNKLLGKVGRPRHEVFVGNATLCRPPDGTPEAIREVAAKCCSYRMLAEIKRFPGKPVLTLGAVAARSVLPKATLDAIQPPDNPKAIKRQFKFKSQPSIKVELKRRKAIEKETQRRLQKMLDHERKRLITTIKVKHNQRPPESYLHAEIKRVHAKLRLKAREEAINSIAVKLKEAALKKKIQAAGGSPSKPKKLKKPKRVKITDIVGTLFDLDIDGTGVRSIIPGIHPAALLRGGGASIGGSHSPDMAFVNLLFDFGKVNALSQGKDIRLHIDVDYEIIDPERALRLFLRVYHDALVEDTCSIDLETYVDNPDKHSALMAYMAKIRVIGIATKNMSVSLAWDLLPPICRPMLQALLMLVECTYHNGLYDRTVLSNQFYNFKHGPRWFDTLLAHHAAFPGNSHKLQVVGSQFYGIAPWKSEFRNAEETPEALAVYNAKDAGVTHALRAPLTKWIKKTQTERVFDLDRKMSDAARHMHLAGMPVDREINSDLKKTFTKSVIEARREVEDIAKDPKKREEIWHHLAIQQAKKQRKTDPKEFEDRYHVRLGAMQLDPDWKWKIGSGKHIAALLMAMGVPLVKTTTGGDISTQKEVLEGLVNVPVVREILNYRENDKLLSTFITPIFDAYDEHGNIVIHGFADPEDRIHPIWNVHRISGRWASQWPVVSNVPKDKWKKLVGAELEAIRERIAQGLTLNGPTRVDGRYLRLNKDNSIAKMVRPNLRSQIRATRPGRIFVGFDYGQIEARVIALISGDPFLMEVFADPTRDIHIECARIIWENFDQLDPDTRKALRENVKNIEYGYMYMAQLETLHNTMLKAGNLININDLAKAIAKLAAKLPNIKSWQQAAVALAMKPPHIKRDFILGRMRSWPMGNVEAPEAVNSEVQFAASAIMNTGMARMMPRLENYQDAWAIAQIHDAAVFELWEDEAERFAADCKDAFEQTYERDGRSVPFGIDVKIGHSWDKV